MKKKEIIGYLLTAATALLFVLMLLQCALYIRLAGSFKDTSLPAFPDSGTELLVRGGEGAGETPDYLVLPCFSGISHNRVRYSLGYFENATNEIWQCFVDVLRSAPGGTAKKVTFPDTQNKESYLDDIYSSPEDSFYVKLPYEIEFSALCALISEKETELPENPDFQISDMFMLCGSGGEAYITAISTDGDVLKIFPSRNIAFNKELLGTYNNTGHGNFDFLKFETNPSYGKNGYFPVYRHSQEVRSIEKSSFSEVFGFDRDGLYIMKFVSAFGLNTDNVRVYETTEGTMVFVENADRLSISENGFIEYIPENDKTADNAFVNDALYTDLGFFEISEMSKDIVGAINDMLAGCAAKLSLTDIIYRDGKCIFYYDYVAGSLPVNSGDRHGLVLEFTRDGLAYAAAEIKPYFYLDNKKTDMPQKTAFTLLGDSISGPCVYFGLQYSFSNEETGIADAEWAAICTEEATE